MGLVHRDVSPQNVLVDRGGVAKLADFGLAKALLHGGESSTTEGILKGKIGYLAPEYIRGEAMDRRADIFALGIMLWEAVTRRRLFRSEREPDVLSKILTMPIPKVASSAASVPLDGLDAILDRCLARKPGDRFATAEAVADALVAFADARGIEVGPTVVAGSFPDSLRDSLDARSKSFRSSPRDASGADPGPASLSVLTVTPVPSTDQTQKLAPPLAPYADDQATRRDLPAALGAARPVWPAIGVLVVLSVLGAGGWMLTARIRGTESASVAPERLAAPSTTESSVPTARELLPADTDPSAIDTAGSRPSALHPGRPPGPKTSAPKASPSGPPTSTAPTGPRPNPYPSASR